MDGRRGKKEVILFLDLFLVNFVVGYVWEGRNG